jgi:hypothetical protein
MSSTMSSIVVRNQTRSQPQTRYHVIIIRMSTHNLFGGYITATLPADVIDLNDDPYGIVQAIFLIHQHSSADPGSRRSLTPKKSSDTPTVMLLSS